MLHRSSHHRNSRSIEKRKIYIAICQIVVEKNNIITMAIWRKCNILKKIEFFFPLSIHLIHALKRTYFLNDRYIKRWNSRQLFRLMMKEKCMDNKRRRFDGTHFSTTNCWGEMLKPKTKDVVRFRMWLGAMGMCVCAFVFCVLIICDEKFEYITETAD